MSRIIKKFLRLSMSLFMVLATLTITPEMIQAEDSGNITTPGAPGYIELDKTRDDGTNGVYEITLTAEGVPDISPTDIVLVIDTSGSMGTTKMDAAKVAAKKFVDDVIGYGVGHRIAIVSFASEPLNKHALSIDPTTLKSAINKLGSVGGTHLEGGIKLANDILAGSPNKKAIVVLSDGEPTYGYDFNMEYNGPVEAVKDKKNCDVSVTPANQANDANYSGSRYSFDYSKKIGLGNNIVFDKEFDFTGTCLKNNGNEIVGTDSFEREFTLKDSVVWHANQAISNGATIFSIGLSVDATGEDVLNTIENGGYYSAAGPSNLALIYADIAAEISPAATNSTVTDVMGAGFTFVGISSGYTAEYASFSGNTLTWNVGSISSTPRVLKYKVQILPGLDSNTYPTNEYANLNYTNINDGPAVKAFPIPKVDIVKIDYTANTGCSVSNASESLDPSLGVAVGSTATASAGFTFANWTDGSTVVGTTASFVPAKVGNLNVAATYHANFTENDRITINYQATLGGSVNNASETLAPATGVAIGSLATPSSGYDFVNWTKDGVAVSTDLNFVPTKVGGLNVAATYIAHFAESQDITINYIANIGGSVSSGSESLAPVTGVAAGSSATAAAGYTFTNWTMSGVFVSSDPNFIPAKVGNLNVAATYHANFTEIENITINYEATVGGSVNNASESLAPATGVAVG